MATVKKGLNTPGKLAFPNKSTTPGGTVGPKFPPKPAQLPNTPGFNKMGKAGTMPSGKPGKAYSNRGGK